MGASRDKKTNKLSFEMSSPFMLCFPLHMCVLRLPNYTSTSQLLPLETAVAPAHTPSGVRDALLAKPSVAATSL